MANTVEVKVHKAYVNGLADLRLSPAVLAYLMTMEPAKIQDSHIASFLAYVQSIVIQHRYGVLPGAVLNDTLVELCEDIYSNVMVPMGLAVPVHTNLPSVDLGE